MQNPKLLIVADENMPAVEQMFGHLGTVRRLPGRTLSATQVADADLLLVRSVSRVDGGLLAGSKVRFVGTATIGTDHVDQAWLAGQGIAFSAAPGCNADAVVDYVLSSLSHLAAERGFSLADKTVGIVGVGNVGGRLQARLQALGIKVLLNDPPRAEHEPGFVSLEQLIAEADILCLHTPLTRGGDYPTHHLFDAERLAQLKPGAILLNAGRGPVIDNRALLARLDARQDLTLVLDVWEHEPVVDRALAAHCAIATPHIAGYSLDGKIRGTYMLYQAWCRSQGRQPEQPLAHYLPPAPVSLLALGEQADTLDPVRLCYDPYRDDRALRQTLHLPPQARAEAFDRLRKQYPVRREFSTLNLRGGDAAQRQWLAGLGFRLVDH
ncbi:4-phosphoerythronate dehydrogenase PdxB [Marinobacterium arenosum]|uniref:4-phosphoerythronate dehydrogenase PdxB n=1 Tax=Marinobacterium arenosum TaxID=2862496 RepID=UPI001C941680|nr:4-phosphoerythronate dehydrogenase PdxB [Marinobacterium arenosum]MBY4678109.1 4-phosphoerythronate dehydrogenase PdxB [Marinobacterium arenosum]